ncbi:MAG: bifunctional adenosylcobinamide kinase/adenosylcobinamide-phosphate guanylyltransferase [Dehalococcoidia bacterium]|nr:bifunctional adenosylcobinamide kinase/adenosylcobinamide-phosphate guanylyltransferase [Dehalococcoidia bacterium]MYD28549.1 bifunctional adenosylcobinamide kinase/adenosylcobinamide-phosphate guanylyltransferase [Dehalococcoidia bacterium]
MSKRLTLVLGGARAGKSTYAQELASSGERVLFVATAEAGDRDIEARIEAHRESRPAEWDTVEEPLDLVGALEPVADRYDMVLLDCLTLWVSNLLLQGGEDGAGDADIPAEVRMLLEVYERGTASWIVVSNEVGLGVVAPTRLGRLYADELGRANQMVAAAADDVFFLAAGLPLNLKQLSGGAD